MKIKFKNWILELTKDERGSFSVKPVIAIIGALFLCVMLAIDCLTTIDLEPSESLVEAVVVITAIGMGADSLDKFSFKNKVLPKTEDTEPQQQKDLSEE